MKKQVKVWEKSDVLKRYVRDAERRRVGVVLAFRDAENSAVRVGWSRCCWKDAFNKALGERIAVGRAVPVFGDTFVCTAASLVRPVADMIWRACLYFKVGTPKLTEVVARDWSDDSGVRVEWHDTHAS